ncbi:protein YgfX [Chromobacterium haemolyticum]|uniref:protein YgfX n=1 Tax=Chromobacterium haemolyticum TaxID=394935 RepID=UPI00307CFDFE
MSRRQRLEPFGFELRPSRLWLSLAAAAGALLAWAVVRYLPTPWLALLPVVAFLLWRALHADGWGDAGRFRRLEVDSLGRLTLWRESALPANPLDDCFVTPWLTVLNVSIGGRRRALMLWPDSAPADGRRRLRTYLLWFQASDDTETK